MLYKSQLWLCSGSCSETLISKTRRRSSLPTLTSHFFGEMLLKYLPLLFLLGVSLAASIEEPSVEEVPADAAVPDVTSDVSTSPEDNEEEALSAAEGDEEDQELECVFTDAEEGEVTVMYTEDEDEVAGVTIVSAEPEGVKDLEEKMNLNCFGEGLQGRRNIRRKKGVNRRRQGGLKKNNRNNASPAALVKQMKALINKKPKEITRVDMKKLNALSRRFVQAKAKRANQNKRKTGNKKNNGKRRRNNKPVRNRKRQAMKNRRRVAGKTSSVELVPEEFVQEEEVVVTPRMEEVQTETKIE